MVLVSSQLTLGLVAGLRVIRVAAALPEEEFLIIATRPVSRILALPVLLRGAEERRHASRRHPAHLRR